MFLPMPISAGAELVCLAFTAHFLYRSSAISTTGAAMLTITDFIQRWKVSGGSEQANSQLFLAELCDVLGVPRPEPALATNEDNVYSFERKVYVGGSGAEHLQRLDLYRKGCFVLESKQGQEASAKPALAGQTTSAAVRRGSRQWEDTMQRARRQGENYIRGLPASEGRPPFLLVADVGFCLDLYAEFSCSGGVYLPFPDARSNRIHLEDLKNDAIRALLQAIWLDPLSLDPARRAARVTEDVAAHLAELARLLENTGHSPDRVAQFLMRCIFTMFAEDVGLLPSGVFTDLVASAIAEPELWEPLVRDLWQAMNTGSVSTALRKRLLRFNGNLFADPEILPLGKREIGILLEAARADWREVEPAIFGTLLERALDPQERHKLGAHYTPRAYVERLVLPTVMQPLRREWEDVQVTASLLFTQGGEAEARKVINEFHQRLCSIRVLDPACGSGNFLYVTLEHMKRLEGEVLHELASYGEQRQTLLQVDPHQFLGLEVNPRAARIAELVLWIGYLQWHFRTHGNVMPAEPVIKAFHNIENRDALLVWESTRDAVNPDGNPRTRWDGLTTKPDPMTGRQVPDESATVTDIVYEGVTAAAWPDADFIVGNPPFVGGGLKRSVLGHGYFEALAQVYGEVPEACDFVMYWWHRAARDVCAGKVRRFGFITTNTITQVFNRRVVAVALNAASPLRLVFAIPDHPWVDAADGAAVRIAMTAGEANTDARGTGELAVVTQERENPTGRERDVVLHTRRGVINADLTIGVDVGHVQQLQANDKICSRGVSLHGAGFIVTPDEAEQLGLGTVPGLERHIRPYRNGRDIMGKCREVMVIDLYGLTADEVLARFPAVYQWVHERVKPERDAKASSSRDAAQYANSWWLFGKPRERFRPALAGLSRYIATVETAKHRVFVFLDGAILPDNMLVNIASDDAFHLGVLSSRIHVCWALAAGGRLGVGNDPRYNKGVCFDTFPFPEATEVQRESIRTAAERLDAHRKARQAAYPGLTLTDMYNVLHALREGRTLTPKEQVVNQQGLVTVLRELHDQLDRAVALAYGWAADAGEQEILANLVALNARRVAAEENGTVRWLRPDYQAPGSMAVTSQTRQAALDVGTTASSPRAARLPWPKEMSEQIVAVRHLLATLQRPVDAVTVARHFSRARAERVAVILETLDRLGIV